MTSNLFISPPSLPLSKKVTRSNRAIEARAGEKRCPRRWKARRARGRRRRGGCSRDRVARSRGGTAPPSGPEQPASRGSRPSCARAGTPKPRSTVHGRPRKGRLRRRSKRVSACLSRSAASGPGGPRSDGVTRTGRRRRRRQPNASVPTLARGRGHLPLAFPCEVLTRPPLFLFWLPVVLTFSRLVAGSKLAPCITLTDKALSHLNQLKQQKTVSDGVDQLLLRIGVKQGGCSGMSYFMDFETPQQVVDDDAVMDLEGDMKLGEIPALAGPGAVAAVTDDPTSPFFFLHVCSRLFQQQCATQSRSFTCSGWFWTIATSSSVAASSSPTRTPTALAAVESPSPFEGQGRRAGDERCPQKF